ncbi:MULTISPECIES: SDR family NAD(P)-dependent oxidoreductase [unclassified Nocardia]|uniref:SDR family NAD(P)-dependent oxidoreductase n=1 Tax=unclassified Nocardia TaxID=2637762 RepID=UPI001CE458DF|nr:MULTISPECIES: SDR family NAD(P)-dependent oxidoreductase [unclassified Nocardia]
MSEFSSAARIVLVTGVDERLGYATALRLATDGATVLAHAQDKERADESVERLVHAGAPADRIRPVDADFRVLAEVGQLGRELAAALPRLDALINAAAIAAPQRKSHTADGHELTFQVNYLAPQRLTMDLAELIAASRGRVLNVTSKLHTGGNIDYTDLDRNRGIYTQLSVYAQSKLALTMFGRSLAETGPAGLTVVNVHPADFEIDMPQVRSHATAPLDTAAALLATLSDPATPVVNGGYYVGAEQAEPAALVGNSRARTRLASWTNQLAA